MPDNSTDSNNNNQQNNNSNSNSNNNSNNNGGGTKGKTVVIGCDSNGADDANYQNTVASIIEQAGYTTEKLAIEPNAFASYSYDQKAKGKFGVYLIAAGTYSIGDATYGNTYFDYNYFGIRPECSPNWDVGDFDTKPIGSDPDTKGGVTDKIQGKTFKEINEIVKERSMCVTGKDATEMGNNLVAAMGGQVPGGSTGSGGGAQIKDKTFEKCIRRICAATDSVFLVESNAAVLFPYVDWMAFTLRQKINTIKSNEIDPNIFSMEYGNEGFYNKVSIAWGGATLPERYPKDEEGNPIEVKKSTNYTSEDILDNMRLTNFNYDTWLAKQEAAANEDTSNNETTTDDKGKTKTKTKKGKTTQEILEDENGNLMLSEQYDSLVDIYGEAEKRVESAAPDFETAQYIVNALLIQYVRDYNNSCKCRALNVRKYIGGTFYSVENPFTKESELFYLNSYTIRTQKDAPMYHDLDFKYGPEGAEELLDYQTYGGGGGGGTTTSGGGSLTEQQVWDRAKVPCHQWTCENLRVSESDTQDPQVAEDYYNKMAGTGQKFCLTCYGMSSFLYYEFNYKANIKCQVIGTSDHHVVMLDRGDGKGFVETREEYRQLEKGYRWDGQGTTVLLPAPSGGTSSGGNTSPTNNNGGNRS